MIRYCVQYYEADHLLRQNYFATQGTANWFAQQRWLLGATNVVVQAVEDGVQTVEYVVPSAVPDAQRLAVYRFLGGAEERAHRAELGW